MGLWVWGSGLEGHWLPGLASQDCLGARVLAAKATPRWTSEEVSMRIPPCVHFSPSAVVLAGTGW